MNDGIHNLRTEKVNYVVPIKVMKGDFTGQLLLVRTNLQAAKESYPLGNLLTTGQKKVTSNLREILFL